MRLRRSRSPEYLSADDVRAILEASNSRDHVIGLQGELARCLTDRHPTRMRLLRRELTWLATEAARIGVTVRVDLP